MIEAIIFDFDGVIVDSEPLHYRAFLKTLADAGLDIQFDYGEYLRKYVGFDDREGFREMIGSANAAAIMAPEFPRRIEALCEAKKRVFAAIVGEGFETIAGVMDFIAGLPRDLPLAIASGATREDIDLILGELKIGSRFDPIVTASDVQRSKPDPATYRIAFDGLAKRIGRSRLQPSDVLAIEDTAAGVESARGAGLITLGLATTTDGQSLHEAHRVIDGFNELTLAKLRQWFD